MEFMASDNTSHHVTSFCMSTFKKIIIPRKQDGLICTHKPISKNKKTVWLDILFKEINGTNKIYHYEE